MQLLSQPYPEESVKLTEMTPTAHFEWRVFRCVVQEMTAKATEAAAAMQAMAKAAAKAAAAMKQRAAAAAGARGTTIPSYKDQVRAPRDKSCCSKRFSLVPSVSVALGSWMLTLSFGFVMKPRPLRTDHVRRRAPHTRAEPTPPPT